MKQTCLSACFLGLAALVSGCKFDNYAAPSSEFRGRIVYKGEPIGVEYNNVNFELWEPGWGKSGAINVAVNQDGSFSSVLFDGTYKLVIPPYQGPFKSLKNTETQSDTIPLAMRGSRTLDLEVLPYYMIRNAKFSGGEGKVGATCALEKIITDASGKAIERVSLYVSKTAFVDTRTSVASQTIEGKDLKDPSAVQLQVTIPALTPSQNYVFARIGVKVAGVEDLLLSPIEKITY